MKSWHPDSGDGSDPFLGGFFSRREEAMIGIVMLVALAILWRLFGLSVAGGALVVVVLVWTMLFA